MSLKLEFFTAVALLSFEPPTEAHDIYSPLKGAVNSMPDRQSCRCASSKPVEINPTALSLSHRAR
jgi:hypothetical protein